MKTWALLCTAMGLALSTPALLAQTKTASPHPLKTVQKTSPQTSFQSIERVSLTVHNAPFRSALDALFLNRSAGYVIEAEVNNAHLMVNATLRDLPFDKALEQIARSVGVRVATSKAGNQAVYTFSMKPTRILETSPPQTPLHGSNRFVTHERADGSIVRSPVQEIDRVTLTVRNSVLRDALDALFLNRGGSYVLHPDVVNANPIINAQIKDMPFDQALETIAKSAGLRVKKEGGVYALTFRKIVTLDPSVPAPD